MIKYLSALCLLVAPVFSQTIIRVDAGAPGTTEDGTSWATAYTDLSDALRSQSYLNATQFWLAEGTYIPTNTSGTPTQGETFQMNPGWELYGAFVGYDPGGTLGGNEVSIAGRNGLQRATILSGDVTGSNDAVTGNCYHILSCDPEVDLFLNAITDPMIVDSVTIQHGYADDSSPFIGSRGAGIRVGNGVDTLNAKLNNVAFINNYADVEGGGVWAGAVDRLTVKNCQFINNAAGDDTTAANGGGIFLHRPGLRGFVATTDPDTYIYNCRFQGNYAATGAAVCMDNWADYATVALGNCSISNNGTDDYNCGQVALLNSALPGGVSNSGELIITHCSIGGGEGGGILLRDNGGSTIDNVDVEIYSTISKFNDTFAFTDEDLFGSEASSATVRYSDIGQPGGGVWTGTGNINANPGWSNLAGNNLNITASSPCVDAGSDEMVSASVGLGDVADLDDDGVTNEALMYSFGLGTRELNVPTVTDTGLDATGTLTPISDMGCYEVIPDIDPL